MIGITIDCRLGNQLFQYAFIKALARRLNTTFFINEHFEKFSAAEYFELDGYSPAKNLLNKVYFKLRHGGLFHSLQSVAVNDYNEAQMNTLGDGQIYRGYFQSEAFFENIITDLPKLIRVKKKFADQFNVKYGQLFLGQQVIVVHVRRGDYLALNSWWTDHLGSNNLTLPVSYYLDALKDVRRSENDKVIFISDDMDFVRSNFKHINNALFAGEDTITDFQLLMNADACIISNSSFAWWAAYLNTKKHKQVICPKYWLGFKINSEYPSGIISSNWITKEVLNETI